MPAPPITATSAWHAVVWLTSDPKGWDAPVLAVHIEPHNIRLEPYLKWLRRELGNQSVDELLVGFFAETRHRTDGQNPEGWFVYLGTIAPRRITFPA